MFANLLVSRRIQRKQLEAIISSDPSVIVLERSQWIDDGTGGKYKSSPVPARPQRVKIIGQSVSVQLPLRTTVDGKVVQASAIMIMERKADVKKGDTFLLGGRLHEVIHIYEEDREVVTRCELLVSG